MIYNIRNTYLRRAAMLVVVVPFSLFALVGYAIFGLLELSHDFADDWQECWRARRD